MKGIKEQSEQNRDTLVKSEGVQTPLQRDELEQAIQSTITYMKKLPMHKPSSSILTETATQQWLDSCYTIRLLVSVLREQSTVRGLKGRP